jgi:hypothetical protein
LSVEEHAAGSFINCIYIGKNHPIGSLKTVPLLILFHVSLNSASSQLPARLEPKTRKRTSCGNCGMVGHNSRSCPNEENRELMDRKKRKHIPTANQSNSAILAISDIVANIEGEEVNDDDDEAPDEIVKIIDEDNEE